MKVQLFIVILFFMLFQSCSSSEEKDRIIAVNLDIIVQDNISWRDDLLNYDIKTDAEQTELRRRYFSNFATSQGVYFRLSTIQQYFDLEDQVLLEYSHLLEKRSELIAPLFRCDTISALSRKELIKVEDAIIEELKSIELVI